MLEEQVAYLLQRYLGDYVRGLNKEALKISVWKGDVELTNMQLKPEALNALKLPVKVKAGFLGSVKLKVPWSRLGQEPVLVHLDRIFLLAEPATQVAGSSEDAVQEFKKNRIREVETKLVESRRKLKTEINKSWIGSLINTVIGNLRLSISNIHIRYEDIESNPGHPFAAGITLDKLSAFTVDDKGEEAFVTGDALKRIQKRVELERMAIYLDSDIIPWELSKQWEDLQQSEWSQVFKFGTTDGKPASDTMEHTYILQPISGNAMYTKLRPDESKRKDQPVQTAVVTLDDVTLCLSKDGYRDMLKLADNFAAFNQRLKFAHYRPHVSVKADPRSWWKYAGKAVSDNHKKASGKMSWEQVLRNANVRKKYISLYAAALKSDLDQIVVDDNEDIEELDRGLDIDVIVQWRMLAHKFVEQTAGADYQNKKKTKKSWFSFGWSSQTKDDNDPGNLTEEDWNRLNSIIGYKEGGDEDLLSLDKGDYIMLKLHMRHNASKLMDSHSVLADLSCDNLACSVKLYSEAKVVDINLGSYRLLSPNGVLAESESASDSLVGVFCYKPLDVDVDWSAVARASPCYVTYLKDSVDDIINFFQSSGAVSQTLARETTSAVQMKLDEVKRTAAKQMNKALKERTRFLLDLDIAAPKITIPTNFSPDGVHPTKLLIDLGKLVIRSKDDPDYDSPEEMNMYSQFDLILRDVFAFLVDGDYSWSNSSPEKAKGPSSSSFISFLPVFDRCGVFLKLQQIRSPVASLPSTRVAVRLPSLNFHFSPSRYHRLLQIATIFQGNDANQTDLARPWDQADFSGWLYILTRKGVGGREAIWQHRYFCIVGQYVYVLENPESRIYEHYYSLRGKHLYQVPTGVLGDADNVLAVYNAERSSSKVLEDSNALLLRFDSEDSRRTWQSYLQGAIYFASATAPLTGLMDSSSDSEDSEMDNHDSEVSSMMESIYLNGVLDELKISVSYGFLADKHDQSLMKLLLAEERPLLEFRTIGGQVEVSIRSGDIFVGTILKALEIEDLILRNNTSQIGYLARSFIQNAEEPLLLDSSKDPTKRSNDLNTSQGDDEFYEAVENLNDSASSPMSGSKEHISSQSIFQSGCSDFKSLSFKRTCGLLPSNSIDLEAGQNTDALDSFVKAQIVFLNQNSPLYSNVDIEVAVKLSTLSFYCRRPSLLAIMEFASAITAKEEHSSEASTDATSADGAIQDTSGETTSDEIPASPLEEPVTKSLLGRGKSRVIFHLVLNMARAEIFLMKEDGSKIGTLAHDNFLTEIKVFPSSFGIRASLGNLKISDDSLHKSHMYYWICDMRNAGGNSFVELEFCSYSSDDEDYRGYDYSLVGQLLEVQFVYLNRFVQEITSYFMGLVPSTPKNFIQIKDQMTNTEKWLTTSEVEGSPAIMFDLSLKKPIILMPQSTSSSNYLKLDFGQIAVRNNFRWFGGDKSDINAVHVDILDILVESIYLNIGSGKELGENIIQDLKGVSIVLRRSLRDLSHQIPSIEVSVAIEELKAALSNKEYEIITECAQSNISETPNTVPPLGDGNLPLSTDVVEEGSQSLVRETSENEGTKIWQQTKVSLRINMVELSLHYGASRDSPLATLQVSGVWLLYTSNSVSEGFLSATLKGLIVVDDREGTEKELRLAIGKPDIYGHSLPESVPEITDDSLVQSSFSGDSGGKYDLPILILDANFSDASTFVSLRIQRPQLLVALDFLIGIAEFFVPTVLGNVSSEDNPSSSPFLEAIVLDQPIFRQPTAEFSLSPQKPLVVDDERFDHFVYDGQGGSLYLKDRQGLTLSSPSREPLVYMGNGKTLQFKNVTFMGGSFLDSCISLGVHGSYSVNENDNVSLAGEDDDTPSDPSSGRNSATNPSRSSGTGRSSELILEVQAISPELTFYSNSRHAGQASLSNKLLHAQMDAFCRFVSKGNTIEGSAEALGFTVESNGIKILEPFDASATLNSSSEKTSIQLSVSDIFMNFSFSILRLFMSVEEDILSFLRTRSQTTTVSCFEFDKIATIKNTISGHIYTFWRPRAPTGFAVLGDHVTPIEKPPTKGVIAVNTSLIKVKRPKSFTLVWPLSSNDGIVNADDKSEGDVACSIWFPEAPKGYVALGCVASPGRSPPPVSSVFCVLSSLVSPCGLRDCISLESSSRNPNVTFWRVDNASGTFLPSDLASSSSSQKAYELRHLYFGSREVASGDLKALENQSPSSNGNDTVESERTSAVSSRRRVDTATFRLIWWNQGSGSRKKLSIWRPVIPEGMVYFGDIAVQGYEPPNTCMAIQDSEDLLRYPSDFQLVGHIKRHGKTDYMSFWMPQAPPGFVSLGCVASKGSPSQSDFSSLRCVRSDMVSTDQFLDENLWDTSETRFIKDPFSIWVVGNELCTFIAWNGYEKPPRRFAFKFVGPDTSSVSDGTLVDAEIRTFSATLFDDYGGLMVPLCNISLSGMWISLYTGPESLNSNVTFSLTASSFNDRYESWEPLIELFDGSLRYESNPDSPGVASHLRITSTTDLNLNVSASNINMILQAYASWNNLGHVDDSNAEPKSPSTDGRPMIAVHQKKNHYVVPQNKLGHDVFIQIFGNQGIPGIVKFSAGDEKALKLSIPKNMLDSHFKGSQVMNKRLMVTVIIAEAEFPDFEGLSSHQYSIGVRLYNDHSNANQTYLNNQTARTSGIDRGVSLSSDSECIKWNEAFYFKIDSVDDYKLELTLTETGNGKIVAHHSSSLSHLGELKENPDSLSDVNQFMWLELSSGESVSDPKSTYFGRIRCAVFLPSSSESGKDKNTSNRYREHDSIQISQTKDGPWATLRLNYGAPVACLTLGNDVIASEVSVTDGNRYVSVRSLVSVYNSTDVPLQLCLCRRPSSGNLNGQREESHLSGNEVETNELFETEKYSTSDGWVPCTNIKEEMSRVQLPPGWEWIDEWHVDADLPDKAFGERWVYSNDNERQRRWIRDRKRATDSRSQITVGHIQPGERVPLPLPCLAKSSMYVLQLKPSHANQYSLSCVLEKSADSEKSKSETYVSDLTDSEELVFCSELSGSSSSSTRGIWFCLSIEGTEIGKDIHFNPIKDWTIVVRPPVSIANCLPVMAEVSLLEMQASGNFSSGYRGVFGPGETVKIYSADIRYPLYCSLLPQKGWLPLHEAVLMSHPHKPPTKTISLRSTDSGRVVQIIIEHNHSTERLLQPKLVKFFSPYWYGVARCPPLCLRLVDLNAKRSKNPFSSKNKKKDDVILEEITEEEICDGYTIASALNFKYHGLSAAIAISGEEQFGPVKDLSPLGDMDGSLDLFAYDAEGNCLQLFVSSKPCPYQSVPTKVISIRPFMTFTNRVGENMLIKFSSEDEPKGLRVSDTRVSFVRRKLDKPDELQVKLNDTDWSFPIQILKEDTITLVLRKPDGTRRFLRTEIRGYEEGSRFIVVFRLGSTHGPIRIENRTRSSVVRFRQAGFGDDAWIQLQALSTVNFSWEDPYGQKVIDTEVFNGDNTDSYQLDLDKAGFSSINNNTGLFLHIATNSNIKVVRFLDQYSLVSRSKDENGSVGSGRNWGNYTAEAETSDKGSPLEIILELGVLGVSIVDHKPRELAYLYMEKFFISYSTGYDGGTTSRFKLVLGYLQLDNQLPMAVMPVLFAPEQSPDLHHPVFKMTVTMRNENLDGLQIYPYVYIRVTDKGWRLNVHEPIIWALVDFFNSLQLDRIPKDSGVSHVDPEIRVDLIDVSEVRLRVTFETAPGERPHGLLGVWGPVVSALGNDFKLQIHLRKVTRKDRFLRKSSVTSAIGNRVWRDLIQNPLHLLFSVDVLAVASSTLTSLGKGFAELSQDGRFLQLRSKQVWSRRITGVGDGIVQGTEVFAQGFAFGISGVVRKPVESARQHGLPGLVHGLGQACLGFVAQPVSGALDFVSLAVDGIGASWSRCLEILSSKKHAERIRNPRAFHADNVLREYSEGEAVGQMILFLAEASRNFGCTRIFKEPSKFAWSDCYEAHFIVPYQRIVLLTNRRVMLLQCVAPDKMDSKPCKIMWDVTWHEVLSLELAKSGHAKPSHLIIHLKSFKRGENFVRVIKCNTEQLPEETEEPQAVKICLAVRRMWKAYRNDTKQIPSSQGYYIPPSWSEIDPRESHKKHRTIITSMDTSSSSSISNEPRFCIHSTNFSKIWSSERESKGRSVLCREQNPDEVEHCSIWRPVCPDGYISIGDIARPDNHPPNVAAVYRYSDEFFTVPVGYDLVWRNCEDDYESPVSIWYPRAPPGYLSLGCVAVPDFEEPKADAAYCVRESLCEETTVEGKQIWSAPDSYPWACYVYQSRSEALQFVALRQPREDSEHNKPPNNRVSGNSNNNNNNNSSSNGNSTTSAAGPTSEGL